MCVLMYMFVHKCSRPALCRGGEPFVVALRCPGMCVGIRGEGVMGIKGKVKV